ncbi:GNAT family N-acetyltransferase [Pilimelia columellifera]|uniref:GNAT family N-acetyltransferase n=1 Tax=Pilimelia columellifera subsp. columellifera TaxID=706583 RepID=A0ABN3N3R0_9ACTN
MLTTPVRHLGASDRASVQRLLDRDPLAAAQVTERLSGRGLSWWRSEGRLVGYGGPEPTSLCWVGAHLVPVLVDRTAAGAFAELLGCQPRICASVVGRAEGVLALWDRLAPVWGPAREIRDDQPLLVADAAPPIPADPAVRLVQRHEVDQIFPAAVAMYEEEIGASPLVGDGGAGYRARLADIVRARRAYARIEDGRVIFKAELAVITQHTAQVQGVWVDPAWRGQGIAAPAMAAVVADALRRVAPTVSLYVNGYNLPARRAYARCGFRSAGVFATVLF